MVFLTKYQSIMKNRAVPCVIVCVFVCVCVCSSLCTLTYSSVSKLNPKK